MSDDAQHDDFRTLLRRVQQGSGDAARELYDAYSDHVLRGVRSRLWHRVRSKYDSQDFAQQVWASFFDGIDDHPHFESPSALVSYLMGMAINKVTDEGRHLLTQKHDIQREQRIDVAGPVGGPHPVSRDPTPSAAAAYRELRDRLVDRQPTKIKSVEELRLSGLTFEEIAAELDMDESTARRIIKRLESQVHANDGGLADDEERIVSERGFRS
jgi:RNA polymerase sigma factor (sigma-70 family)